MKQNCLLIVSKIEYYISHRIEPQFDGNGKFLKLNLNLITSPDIFDTKFDKRKNIINLQNSLYKYNVESCILSPFQKKSLFRLYNNEDSIRYNKLLLNIEEMSEEDINPTNYKYTGRKYYLFTTELKMCEFWIKKVRHTQSNELYNLQESIENFKNTIESNDKFRSIVRELDISELLKEGNI